MNDIMSHNGKLYQVKRRVAEHNFTFKDKLELKAVEMYMKHIGCDHVLRDQTHFIFVETVQEAQIVE
jgi:hypothetical protein